MSAILIKNAQIVNEREIINSDVLIEASIISKIENNISHPSAQIIDAKGKHLLPGLIDDQVHFREPGLTHKATISSESRACIAGGITSFVEQPNTNPQTVTIEALENKMELASKNSFCNYSFTFGGTNDNLEEIKKLDPLSCAAIKLFLGSSTGNMLVDNEKTITDIFSNTPMVICTHCEDEQTIQKNLDYYSEKYQGNIPMHLHSIIRSEDACYLSSSKAIGLAKQTGARLHVFHLSTAKEISLFENSIPLIDKRITAEVCVHHLWFDDRDYQTKGSLIKWNPAVKTEADKEALWQALRDDKIDVIATDHAPHTIEEKSQSYLQCPSGGPLVQHALLVLLEKSKQGVIPITTIVQKMCHNPAIVFQIQKRGYIREGYFADLVLIDMQEQTAIEKKDILYKCGWSPFEGTTFSSRITHTLVNGHLVYNNGNIHPSPKGERLTFNRI